MSAEDVLRWAHEQFGERMCLTCSWQRQSSVLVHMVNELALDIPIVELDTLVLFPETYETRERLVERYGLTLQSFRPLDAPDRLWEREPHPLLPHPKGRAARACARAVRRLDNRDPP